MVLSFWGFRRLTSPVAWLVGGTLVAGLSGEWVKGATAARGFLRWSSGVWLEVVHQPWRPVDWWTEGGWPAAAAIDEFRERL